MLELACLDRAFKRRTVQQSGHRVLVREVRVDERRREVFRRELKVEGRVVVVILKEELDNRRRLFVGYSRARNLDIGSRELADGAREVEARPTSNIAVLDIHSIHSVPQPFLS